MAAGASAGQPASAGAPAAEGPAKAAEASLAVTADVPVAAAQHVTEDAPVTDAQHVAAQHVTADADAAPTATTPPDNSVDKVARLWAAFPAGEPQAESQRVTEQIGPRIPKKRRTKAAENAEAEQAELASKKGRRTMPF